MRRILLTTLVSLSLPTHSEAGADPVPEGAGLKEVAPGLWVEGGEDGLPADIAAAEARVAAFWGEAPPRPRIFVCTTPACDAALGLEHVMGMAYGAYLVVLTSRADHDRVTILAHELGHVALARRIGAFDLLRDGVPAWLVEGLASLGAVAPGYRVDCERERPATLPATAREWRLAIGEREGLYTDAACAARDWLETHMLDDL